MDRIIRLSTVRNGRDLGGLVNRAGRAIRPGMLLRTANLSETTEADLRALRDGRRLALVVDLRTTPEREGSPDCRIEGVEYAVQPIFDDRVIGVTHEKRSEAERVPVTPDMSRIYRKMCAEEPCRSNFGRAARRVMEFDFTRGSVLWHCSEGKDRAGVMAAILLLALDVDRSEILADYELTNLVNARRSVEFYHQLLAMGRSEEEARMVRESLLAKPEFLQAVFDTIDERFGGTEAYLREGLALDDGVIARFRASVLA